MKTRKPINLWKIVALVTSALKINMFRDAHAIAKLISIANAKPTLFIFDLMTILSFSSVVLS